MPNRRHFLQSAAATVTALGLHQTHLFQQADHAIAQGKPGRKLALLVGINGYTSSPLFGCHTDVELQWNLLVYRYGFSPKDVLVVADREFSFLNYKPLAPTRKNILEAYEKHLIVQATPDSTAVFFFSGHGSMIQDPNPLPTLLSIDFDGNRLENPNDDKAAGTIVPIDYRTNNPNEANDIMGKTLFLLTYALGQKTQNITTILDCCHSGATFRGDLIVRSLRNNPSSLRKPSPQELDYQKQWLTKLNLSESEFQRLRTKGIAAGVAIGAVQHDQLAADAKFDGFRAGALNYTLTRYLWQQSVNESIDAIFANIASRTQEIGRSSFSDQVAIFDVSHPKFRQQPIFLSQPTQPFADAIVRQIVSKDRILYWLGGMSIRSLSASQPGTILSVINQKGEEIGQIEHLNRDGLAGKGKLIQGNLKDIQIGTLLREKVRGLPNDLKLRIGLDASLGKDLIAAKTELSRINRIAVVTDRPDFYLGRITPEYKQQFANLVPELKEGSIGLFSSGLTPMPAIFAEPGEAIQEAISRLRSKLQSLLATMILKTMGGIDIGNNSQTRSLTLEVSSTEKSGNPISPNKFTPGTPIQINVKNIGSESMYVGVLSIGSAGNLRVLYPYSDDFDSPEERARLQPGKELRLPEANVRFALSKTPGAIEIMVFSSRQPIRDALRALKTIAQQERGGLTSRSALSSKAMQGSDAVDTLNALLGDIDRNTRSDVDVKSEIRGVSVNQFSLISTVIEGVK